MAGQGEGTAQTGFFGRLFSRQAADGEPKKKPVKAKLGQKNDFFYDEELKVWRERGKPPPENAGLPPPPPTMGFVSRGASFGEELGPAGQPSPVEPSRSWSNSSLDKGLPAPSTPTAATSTFFSGGPSAGTGPAAQSPFRARNVRANTAARYAASSLIPTKPGAATTTSSTTFPSMGKPPLAPAPAGVAMFNPGAAAGGAAAPAFFIPGGVSAATTNQAPFFGSASKGGRAGPPAFGVTPEGQSGGQTPSGRPPADGGQLSPKGGAYTDSQEGGLLSPRDKRQKLDSWSPRGADRGESVGDNLGASYPEASEEAVSPYLGGGHVPLGVPALSSQGSNSYRDPEGTLGGVPESDMRDPFSAGGSSFLSAQDPQGQYGDFYGGGTGYGAETNPEGTEGAAGVGTEGVGRYGMYGAPGWGGLGSPEGALEASGHQPADEGAFGNFSGPGEPGQSMETDPFAAGEAPHGSVDPYALPGTFGGDFSTGDADPFAAGELPERPRSSFGGTTDTGAFGSAFFPGAASTGEESAMGSLAETGVTGEASVGSGTGPWGQETVGRGENFGGEVPGEIGVSGSYAPYQATETPGEGYEHGAGYGGDYDPSQVGGVGYTAEYEVDTFQAGYQYDAAAAGAGEMLYGGYTWDQVLQFADSYRNEGYTEEEIQEWLRQTQASGVPAQQAEGVVMVESAAAGVTAGAEGFTGAEAYGGSHADQSLDALVEGGAALQTGTGDAWVLPGSGTHGDQGLGLGYQGTHGDAGGAQGYGDHAMFAGDNQGVLVGEQPTGQTMTAVVQEDATSYYSETYQLDPRAQTGTTGFGGWAGKFSALTTSRTTVTTGFLDRVGLADWLADKSSEGKITGPLPWDMQSTATSAEGDGDEGKGSGPGSPILGSPTADETGASPEASQAAYLPAHLLDNSAAIVFPPVPRTLPGRGSQAPHVASVPTPEAAEGTAALAASEPSQLTVDEESMQSGWAQQEVVEEVSWQQEAQEWPPSSQQWPLSVSVGQKGDSPGLGRTTSIGSQTSGRSFGTSVARNQGTPTSSKSYPAESQAPNCSSLPTSPTSRAIHDHGAERWEDAHKGYGTQLSSSSQPLHEYPNGSGFVGQEPIRTGSGGTHAEAHLGDSTVATYGGSEAGQGGVRAPSLFPASADPSLVGHASVPEGASALPHGGYAPKDQVHPGGYLYEQPGQLHASPADVTSSWQPQHAQWDGDTFFQDSTLGGDAGSAPEGAQLEGRGWVVDEAGVSSEVFLHTVEQYGYEQVVYHQTVEEVEEGQETDSVPPLPQSRSPPQGSVPIQRVESIGTAPLDFDSALMAFINEPPAVLADGEWASRSPRAKTPGSPQQRPEPNVEVLGNSPRGLAVSSPIAITELADVGTLTDGWMDSDGELLAAEKTVPSGEAPAQGGFELETTAAAETQPSAADLVSKSSGTSITFPQVLREGQASDVTFEPSEGSAFRMSPFAAVIGHLADDSSASAETGSAESFEDHGFEAAGDWGDHSLSLEPGQQESGRAPRRESGLRDKEPTLAAWGDASTGPSTSQGQATDYDLKGFAANLRPLNVPPSPAQNGQPSTIQEELDQLRDRNDDLESELSDVKAQLDSAVRESRNWAKLYSALEEKMEDITRNMAAMREENDVLRAQAASLLAEADDEAKGRSSGELQALQSLAEEGSRAAEAARQETEQLRGLLAEAEEALERTQLELRNTAAQVSAPGKGSLAGPDAGDPRALDAAMGSPEGAAALLAELEKVTKERDELVTKNADLVTESLALADDLLAKDEEIEKLQGDLVHALKDTTGAASEEIVVKLQHATWELEEAHRASEELQKQLAMKEAQLQESQALQQQLDAESQRQWQEAAAAKQMLEEAMVKLEEAAAVKQKLEEAERQLLDAASAKEDLQEAKLKLEEAEGQLNVERHESEKLRRELEEALARVTAMDEASEKSVEASKQLQLARKDVAKLQAALKSRTAELKNTRKGVEEANAALAEAKAEAAAAIAARDDALARARLDRTRLENERNEALALAHAEIVQLQAKASTSSAATTLKAELEAEKGLVAELKQELAQFKEQSRLDFERIGVLAEENQRLQEELENAAMAEGNEGLADELNEALTERDRLALRCAELEATAHGSAGSPETESRIAALQSELEALKALERASGEQISLLQEDLASQNALLAEFSEAKSVAEERALAAETRVAEQEAALAQMKVASSSTAERVAALEQELEGKDAALAQLQVASAGNAEQLAAAQAALAEAEAARSAVEAQAADMGIREGELHRELAETRARVDAEIKGIGLQAGKAEAAVTALHAELDQARSAAAKAEEEVERLREEADVARAAREAAEQQLRQLEEAAKAASLAKEAEVERLQQALDAETAEVESLMCVAEKVAGGDAEVAALRDALATAQADLEAARAELALASSGNVAGSAEVAQQIVDLQQRLAEVEAEAENLFARQSELEEEAAAAEGQAAAAAKARDAALAHAAQLEAQLTSTSQEGSGVELESMKARLAKLEEELEEQRQDHADLLACLGQESAKLEALASALDAAGMNSSKILNQVEEEYGFGDKSSEDDLALTADEHGAGTSHEGDTSGEGLKMPGGAACISTRAGPMGEEDAGGTPDGDKVGSSGTTSDGSWRVVSVRTVDSDWAEVPLEQVSRPPSPEQPPSNPPGGLGLESVATTAQSQGTGIPFGQAPQSLAHVFGGPAPGERTLPQGLPDGPDPNPDLDIDSWDTDWATTDM